MDITVRTPRDKIILKTHNKLTAISIAVILFIILHYLLALGSNYLVSNSVNFSSLLPILNLFAYILYFLSGFIAGILTEKQIIVVGIIASLISSVLAVLLFGVSTGDLIGMLITLVTAMVLGGLGGSLSFFLKRNVQKAL